MSKTPHTILGCGILIVRERKVLLAPRLARDKPGYGLWAMPGGTVEPGESPEQAAEREVNEETGLTVVSLDRLPLWHWTADWAEHPWLTLYFQAGVRGIPVRTEPAKQGRWCWFAGDELPLNVWHGIPELCEMLGLL
jgi:8-oxo-dGTP diphosphatase